MPRYVDGFVIPVPRKNLAAYRRMARACCKIWLSHGALAYVETVGDDLKIKGMGSFLRRAGAKRGETVLLSWIVYRSRAHRDRVNRKIMADRRIARMCRGPMPFDVKRMAYGGFKVLVQG
jgi:uncharacterized protein YbaA (DUF1428 family)